MAFDVKVLKKSFSDLEAKLKEIGSETWSDLLKQHPELASILESVDRDECIEIFSEAFVFLFQYHNFEQRVASYFRAVGIRYYAYGMRQEHYEWIAQSCMTVLQRNLGHRWNDETGTSWLETLTVMTQWLQEGILSEEQQINAAA